MSAKRKRVVVSLETKWSAIKRLDKGESIKSVATDLGVGEVTVGDWKRKRIEIEKWVMQSASVGVSDLKSLLSLDNYIINNSGQTEHLIESETDNSWMDMKEENVPTSVVQPSDVLLVPLEVRTLSAKTCVPTWRTVSFSSTTPPSSVDLEWENEAIVGSNNGNIPLTVHRRLTSTTTEDGSNGSVSVVECSPAESLEWDPCETTLDNDTEQLLCEIERLTARALRETGGDWTNR